MVNKTNHPARGKLLKFTCAHCGGPIERYESEVQNLESVHCSHSCQAKSRALENGFGLAQKYECACGCGGVVLRPPSKVMAPDAVFLNREHYLTWRHGAAPGTRGMQWFQCACGCEKMFERKASDVRNPAQVYFNREHYLKTVEKKNHAGEK